MGNGNVSRREVLGTIGAGVGALTLGTGTTSAAPSGRHIVGTTGRRATAAAERRADSVHRVLDFGTIGNAVAGQFSEAALDALQRNPNVRYIEPDGSMRAIAQQTPWGIDRVDADVVHANGETGGDNSDGEGGADIAIIDTGIDSDHPDLDVNVGTGHSVVDCTPLSNRRGGCGFGAQTNDNPCNFSWDDDNNHGSHVAGSADADDDDSHVVGVSTGATLHAIKVLDACGSGSFSDVAEGIRIAADEGYDVANMSIGGSKSSAVEDAVEYAYNNGVLLVASAGNSGPCTDCVGYPAAEPEVIAVSASSEDDSLANFSSTGPEVEIAAPGEAIVSTVPPESDSDGLASFSGTSMSSPHVAGAGAQLMDNGYTNTAARDQLGTTAEDIGLASNEQGNGLLDVETAVLGADAAPTVAWVTPAEGDTVAGTITIQIDASDSEDSDDSLDVTYTVDGGSSRSTSYNSTTGYYEDAWDTTNVSDGDHTLEATASDSADNTTTSSITVTTDNTESTPTVDSLSMTEVETSDGDAEFDVDWAVSDSDGDLSSIDLVLTQDSNGEQEDTAAVSVTGDTDSGTTRLVASGDEGTGNSYTVEGTVTDSSGNTDSATASATESEADPAVDSLSATEVETGDSDAEFDVSWQVSDADGDLETVDLTLTQSDGSTEDTVQVSLSGSSASDTTRLVAAGDDGSGNNYTIGATVTDSFGNTGTDSTSITESEDTSTAPTIDSYSVTEAGSPNPHAEITADWAVSDADGDLDTVVVEVVDSSGSVVGSATNDVTGSDATGSNEFKIRHVDGQSFDVVLTVSDAAGNAASTTRTVSE